MSPAVTARRCNTPRPRPWDPVPVQVAAGLGIQAKVLLPACVADTLGQQAGSITWRLAEANPAPAGSDTWLAPSSSEFLVAVDSVSGRAFVGILGALAGENVSSLPRSIAPAKRRRLRHRRQCPDAQSHSARSRRLVRARSQLHVDGSVRQPGVVGHPRLPSGEGGTHPLSPGPRFAQRVALRRESPAAGQRTLPAIARHRSAVHYPGHLYRHVRPPDRDAVVRGARQADGQLPIPERLRRHHSAHHRRHHPGRRGRDRAGHGKLGAGHRSRSGHDGHRTVVRYENPINHLVADERVAVGGRDILGDLMEQVLSKKLTGADQDPAYTFGWDTVFAIRVTDVNAELGKPGVCPASFQISIPSFFDTEGAFANWRIATGAAGSSGTQINMQAGIPSGTLTYNGAN